MFRLFECCALSFFERFVLSFSLKIERFVSDSAEIWICGLYIKQSLKDNFGFWDSIQLNEKQEASLKKVYDESFSGKEIDLTKSEYQQDEPLAAEAKRILDDIALVGWTSGGHSGGYVPVFAIGAGAQLFQGRIDNTEIPVKIAEAAGYPNN